MSKQPPPDIPFDKIPKKDEIEKYKSELEQIWKKGFMVVPNENKHLEIRREELNINYKTHINLQSEILGGELDFNDMYKELIDSYSNRITKKQMRALVTLLSLRETPDDIKELLSKM